MLKAIFLIIGVSACLIVFGHGDVHERIQIVTDGIALEPDDASLYVKRASLYTEDEDFENTLIDLKQAQSLAGKHFPPALMAYAEMYHQLGSSEVALKYIDLFLEKHPIHVIGFRIKASILKELGDINGTIDYYKKVLIHTTTPLPENYMFLIEELHREGRYDEAQFYSAEALKVLGNLIVFQQKMIDLYLATNNYEAAIIKVDKIMEGQQRKEKWHYKKALICREAGDDVLAQQELALALRSIRALPQRIQATPAMQSLTTRIQDQRSKLKTLTHDQEIKEIVNTE